MTYCLKRKNQKTIFSFQSMPNLNFAELMINEHINRDFSLFNCPATPLSLVIDRMLSLYWKVRL